MIDIKIGRLYKSTYRDTDRPMYYPKYLYTVEIAGRAVFNENAFLCIAIWDNKENETREYSLTEINNFYELVK